MLSLPLFLGYRGDATNAYNIALQILKTVLRELPATGTVRFGIGGRHTRLLSIESDSGNSVPNVFQLSSGQHAPLGIVSVHIEGF